MTIETITHEKHVYSSGIEQFTDSVQSMAEDVNRQEVTLKGAIEAQANDVYVYIFLPGQDEWGLDPWRVADGIAEYVDGSKVEVWFESGACKVIDPKNTEYRFFVSKKDIHNH